MEQENIIFIAGVLVDELKEEIRNYKPYHSMWVNDLIKATKDLFENNGLYMLELNRLIAEYHEKSKED